MKLHLNEVILPTINRFTRLVNPNQSNRRSAVQYYSSSLQSLLFVFYECSQEVYWLSLFAQDGQEEVQRKVDDDAKYSGNDAQHLHLVGQVLEDAQQADGRPLVFGGILSDAGGMHFPWVAWAFSRRRWTAGSVQ